MEFYHWCAVSTNNTIIENKRVNNTNKTSQKILFCFTTNLTTIQFICFLTILTIPSFNNYVDNLFGKDCQIFNPKCKVIKFSIVCGYECKRLID